MQEISNEVSKIRRELEPIENSIKNRIRDGGCADFAEYKWQQGYLISILEFYRKVDSLVESWHKNLIQHYYPNTENFFHLLKLEINNAIAQKEELLFGWAQSYEDLCGQQGRLKAYTKIASIIEKLSNPSKTNAIEGNA